MPKRNIMIKAEELFLFVPFLNLWILILVNFQVQLGSRKDLTPNYSNKDSPMNILPIISQNLSVSPPFYLNIKFSPCLWMLLLLLTAKSQKWWWEDWFVMVVLVMQMKADESALLSIVVNQLQHLLSCLQLWLSNKHSLLFMASSCLLLFNYYVIYQFFNLIQVAGKC